MGSVGSVGSTFVSVNTEPTEDISWAHRDPLRRKVAPTEPTEDTLISQCETSQKAQKGGRKPGCFQTEPIHPALPVIRLELDTNLSTAAARIAGFSEKSIRFAAARSLTASVQKAQADMKKAISSPNGPIEGGASRWTVGALRSQWAKPTNLIAEVGFASDQPRAAGRYLQPLIRGGQPIPKAVDRRVAAASGGTSIRGALLPTRGTKLDRRGNVPFGTLGKELQGLGEKGSGLFIRPLKRRGGFGLFLRSEGFIGRTSTIERRAQLLFKLDPTPKPRRQTFPLHQLLRKSVDEFFPGHYRASIEAELRRAGFS